MLVFIIMVVFWALGSLIKRKPNKTQLEEKDQQLEETLSRHRQASLSSILHQRPKKVISTPSLALQAVSRQQKRQLNIAEEQTKPSPVPPPQDKLQSQTTGTQQPKPRPTFLLDLNSPQNLRAAILYHEILSAPLSLRESPPPNCPGSFALDATSDKPPKSRPVSFKK